MTAIATQGTGLRHVRKTITFDGSANNGNLGDTITVFTLTGSIAPVHMFTKVTETLVCAAPDGTSISLYQYSTDKFMNGLMIGNGVGGVAATAGDWAVPAIPDWIPDYGTDHVFDTGLNGAWGHNLVLSVDDEGAGANITDGTIVIDCWYYPITDDGALAGDDIDTELVAAIWANATRTLTALGFTLGASDLAADTITASKIAADAITAAKIATGAVDADALATDAVTEIVTAMLTTAMTESYNADGAAPTLAQALFLLIAALTEFSISGTTITAKKLDGSTTAATFTLNSSTTPTSRTRAT